MTAKELKEINYLAEKIDEHEKNIHTIDAIMSGCKVSATISGFPRSSHTEIGFISVDRDIINSLLLAEKMNSETKLAELKGKFDQIKILS